MCNATGLSGGDVLFIFRHQKYCSIVEFPLLVHIQDCRIAWLHQSVNQQGGVVGFQDLGLEWECKPWANVHRVSFPSFRRGKQWSYTAGRYWEDKCRRNITDTTVMSIDSGHRFSLFSSLTILMLLLLILLQLLNSQIIIYYQATHILYILCTTKAIKTHKRTLNLIKIGKWGVSHPRLSSWQKVYSAVIYCELELCFA